MQLKYNGDTGENFVNTLKKMAAIYSYFFKNRFLSSNYEPESV